MKKALVMVSVLAASLSASAKITIFSNQDAAVKVLVDSKTMEKVNKANLNGEFTGLLVTSAGEGAEKRFLVTVRNTKETPIGERACMTDVELHSVIKKVKIGASEITANELKIVDVSNTRCEK